MKRTAALLALLLAAGCASTGQEDPQAALPAEGNEMDLVLGYLPDTFGTYFLYRNPVVVQSGSNGWSSALRGRTK